MSLEARWRAAPRRHVVGYVDGELLVRGGHPVDADCCPDCGAAPHRGRACRGYGSAGEANEGHRGDEW